MENEHQAFISDGCYRGTVNVTSKPLMQKKSTSLTMGMDFVSMSRCMLTEGTQVWIRLNSTVYAVILQQAEQQGSKVMLAVSQQLHDNMPAQHSRYLRGFYTLGGSMHREPIESNGVQIICVVAGKRSAPGKKAAADVTALAVSRVNQNIGAENTRFVAISLPILHEDGSPVIDYYSDPASVSWS